MIRWENGQLVWMYRGDIRADFGTSSTSRILVSATAATSGKKYAEVVFDTVVSPGSAEPFLMMGLTTIGGQPSLQMPEVGLNFNGKVYVTGISIASDGPTFTNGDVGMVAVDTNTGKVWLGKVGVGWYGGGNPTIGVNPITTLAILPYYVTWGESRSSIGIVPVGCKTTLRTQSSQFTGSIPSGFSPWYP